LTGVAGEISAAFNETGELDRVGFSGGDEPDPPLFLLSGQAATCISCLLHSRDVLTAPSPHIFRLPCAALGTLQKGALFPTDEEYVS
jgi:hypothetical protein